MINKKKAIKVTFRQFKNFIDGKFT